MERLEASGSPNLAQSSASAGCGWTLEEVTVRQPLSLFGQNPNPKLDSLVNVEQLHLLRAIFQGCDDRHAASLPQAPTIARL
jgi:hypothetical protein